MLDYIGVKIVDITPFSPFHIVALAQRQEKKEIDNSKYISESSQTFRHSIFRSDLT
jgi:hypothetical protein